MSQSRTQYLIDNMPHLDFHSPYESPGVFQNLGKFNFYDSHNPLYYKSPCINVHKKKNFSIFGADNTSKPFIIENPQKDSLNKTVKKTKKFKIFDEFRPSATPYDSEKENNHGRSQSPVYEKNKFNNKTTNEFYDPLKNSTHSLTNYRPTSAIFNPLKKKGVENFNDDSIIEGYHKDYRMSANTRVRTFDIDSYSKPSKIHSNFQKNYDKNQNHLHHYDNFHNKDYNNGNIKQYHNECDKIEFPNENKKNVPINISHEYHSNSPHLSKNEHTGYNEDVNDEFIIRDSLPDQNHFNFGKNKNFNKSEENVYNIVQTKENPFKKNKISYKDNDDVEIIDENDIILSSRNKNQINSKNVNNGILKQWNSAPNKEEKKPFQFSHNEREYEDFDQDHHHIHQKTEVHEDDIETTKITKRSPNVSPHSKNSGLSLFQELEKNKSELKKRNQFVRKF